MTEAADTSAPVSEGTRLEDDAEQRNSTNVTLADYCAKGTACYAQKHYVEAVDFYAQASEIQAQLNGDMDPQNADILFLYGRALFKVGQSKSDVLGGNAGGAAKKSNGSNGSNGAKKRKKSTAKMELREKAKEVDQELKVAEEQNDDASKSESEDSKKPLFQFTGDENFEDSEGEEAEEEAEDQEEPEDDLASAFEILELARVLFTKQSEALEIVEGEGKDTDTSPMIKHIKERLADTHDLLAEICLENERFPGAVSDFRSSLHYKTELYPEDCNIIAEAHYKLSLALEFASLTRSKHEDGAESQPAAGEENFDQAMRAEAASELEAAIRSSKLKLNMKEVELASTSSPDDNDITRAQIADVKEMVADMETRLKDLKGSPIDVRSALYGPAGLASTMPTGGVLGATVGEAPEVAAARIEEAAKNANDLTGTVRRKIKHEPETEVTEVAHSAGEKRKPEDEVVQEGGKSPKKARVEDAPDSYT